MDSTRELAWHERHFVALVIGGMPLFVLGWLVGIWRAEACLLPAEMADILWGGFCCGIVPVVLGCLLPRAWALVALAYVAGFMGAVVQMRALAPAITGFINAIVGNVAHTAGVTWAPVEGAASSAGDLLWMGAIALWLGWCAAILRRSRRVRDWNRRWQASIEH